MSNADIHDRRTFSRENVVLPIRYLEHHYETESRAKTLNISANGLSLTCQENIPKDTHLDIWLNLHENKPCFHTKGMVIWAQRVSDNETRIGIKLNEPDLLWFSHLIRNSPE